MERPKLTLRALELFDSAARTRSLVETAAEMGCAVSSVSRHIAQLEAHLGAALFDHGRRPIALTPAGQAFHRRIGEGLRLIRLGVSETAATPGDAPQDLRIAMVEEFENAVATALLGALADRLPRARFQLVLQPSHQAIERLRARQLDIAVVTEPSEMIMDLVSRPLMRDPFVIAAPKDWPETPDQMMAGTASLPFLRYNPDHVIGRQVAAHLRRRHVTLENRFEIDSNQSILGLVAEGRGWSLTTAMGYLRARRYQDQVTLHPAPGPAFARYLALFALPDFSAPLTAEIEAALRRFIAADIVAPAVARYDWLSERLALIEGEPALSR